MRFTHIAVGMIVMSLIFSACDKPSAATQEEIMSDAAKIIALQQSLRLSQLRYDRLSPVHLEIEALCRCEEEQKKIIHLKKQTAANLQQDRSKIDAEQRHYVRLRKEALLRKRSNAIAQKFDVFSSFQRDYHNVVITSVDPHGIEITHKDGRARVAIEHLSSEQIECFGLDRDEARLSRAEEQKQALAFASFVDQSLEQKEKLASLAPKSVTKPAPRPQSTGASRNPAKPSPFSYSSSQDRPVYRVRNQGRPTYYYVIPCPSPYCPSTHSYNPYLPQR
jgi:hypothetical protein